jgi:hypothetical protein
VEHFFEGRSAVMADPRGAARIEDPAHGPSSEHTGFDAAHGT